MINTKVVKATTKAVRYPCLKRSLVSSAIILFTEPCTGMVVSGMSEAGRITGAYYDNWRESDTELFTGKLELTNEV